MLYHYTEINEQCLLFQKVKLNNLKGVKFQFQDQISKQKSHHIQGFSKKISLPNLAV